MSPTRAESGAATRVRILDGAERLCRACGPTGFTMDTLAQEAGVARATVYEHFPSKHILLDALAVAGARSVSLDYEVGPISDPRRALSRLLVVVCEHWAEHGTRIRELSDLAAVRGADPPTHAVSEDYLRRIVGELLTAGYLRSSWSTTDTVDALAVLMSFTTYEQLCRSTRRAQRDIPVVLLRLTNAMVMYEAPAVAAPRTTITP